nr:carboxypeptidase-like regulatory domain-containing protein [uncultured Capnocytophaga sp.]
MKTLFLILLFTATALPAQVAELTLLDASTKQPIPNVEAYYTHSLNGTITNEEGKLRIAVENDTLTLSHIGYATKKIFTDKTFAKATIYLNPQEIQLDEVVLYNFDLQGKIDYIFNNYNNLYDTKTKILECTYREKFIRNDTLTRLYQLQLDWWSKFYGLNFKQPLDNNMQIHLKNTDYAKVSDYKDIANSPKGAHLTTNSTYPYLFINTYLILIRECKNNIDITKIEKDKEFTKITFNAENVDKDNKVTMKLVNSEIYFDKTTNAIKRVVFNNKTREKKEDISEKFKIPYTYENKGFSVEINFSSYKDKLLFSSLFIRANGAFEYQGKTDIVLIEQSFLRTGLQEGKHIKKSDRINIEKPFFEYVTPHKQGEAKFLLTKEEQEFINQ